MTEHVAQARESFGPVSLLVDNAGVLVAKTVADSTDADWDLQVGVNCRGVFNVSRAVLPEMTEHGGVVVNIGSISGVVSDLTSASAGPPTGIVAWLASEEASWATGQCFTVDGGLTAASPLRPELF